MLMKTIVLFMYFNVLVANQAGQTNVMIDL